MVPPTQVFHQSAAYKHRVATQWRHATARKEMERRLEPEKVFQDVQETEPLGVMIHKLDATLDDINRFVQKNSIDNVQNVGVRLVLGVKNGDNVNSCHFKNQVQLMWLSTVFVVRYQQFDIGSPQLFEFFLRYVDGSGIVFAQ